MARPGDFDGAGGGSSSPAAPSGDLLGAAAAVDQFWSDVGQDEEDMLELEAVDLWLME